MKCDLLEWVTSHLGRRLRCRRCPRLSFALPSLCLGANCLLGFATNFLKAGEAGIRGTAKLEGNLSRKRARKAQTTLQNTISRLQVFLKWTRIGHKFIHVDVLEALTTAAYACISPVPMSCTLAAVNPSSSESQQSCAKSARRASNHSRSCMMAHLAH